MSLSIDVHNAVAAAVLPPSKTGAASLFNEQTPSHGAETTSTGAGTSAAYTIADSASTGAAMSTQAPAGVKADLDGDGARLMALQVKQALTGYTGAIANQSSQAILSLFRN